MKIVNTSPGSNLLLGRQGENKARAIVFYIGPWVETYGAGVAQLLHQRKGDHDPYPVVITQEDNEVRWVVSEVDTSLAGAGRYELHYYVGDTLVKSSTGDTFVEGSMMFSTDPPDPYQGWFDRVEAAGSKAVEAEKKAMEAASAAAESAESAAKNAEEAKDAAQSIPQTVEAALQEAKESGEFDGPAGPAGPAGETGKDGQPGKDGYTPQKGVDYFDGKNGQDGKDGQDYVLTEADKAEIAEQAAALVDVPEGGSGITVTAKPGQLIRVKEVDENGNPTAWEAAEDMPWAEGGRVEVLAETTLTEENFMEVLSAIPPLGLVVGNTYVVNISGVEYTCVAETNEDFGFPVTLLLTDGMPFFVAEVPTEHAPQVGTNVMIEVMTEDAKLPATLSIYADGEVVHPLDPKYLPEGVPYVETGTTDLLPETEASSFTHPSFGTLWGIYRGIPDLKVGETYTITYNGTPYECVCQSAPAGLNEDPNAVAMGNFAVVGGANTGEPFAMLVSYAYQELDVIDFVGSSTVKVKITGIGKIGHKTEEICLPDTARVLVVKFEEREDGNLVSLSHNYLQMRSAINEGVPVVCIVQHHDRRGGSSAIFGCGGGDSFIIGIAHDSGLSECYWYRAWEYNRFYLDGDTSNKTIGNEIWEKGTS